MLAVIDRCGLAHALIPGQDVAGRLDLTIAAKGTWAFAGGRLAPAPADRAIPIHHAPEYLGEPGASSLRWPGDGAPAGDGTDVLVLGAATSREPLRERAALVAAGEAELRLRLLGPRRWERGLLGWRAGDAEPAARIELGWERSVGGVDGRGRRCERNPIGRGWAAPTAGAPLPQVDDPASPYRKPGDRPQPVGVGAVDPAWQPRLGYAGTYDDAWRRRRAPLLPADFDARFHRAASGPLALARHLGPADGIRLEGFTPAGSERIPLPGGAPQAIVRHRGSDRRHAMALCTAAVLPEDGLLALTWKATLPLDALEVDCVWIVWEGPRP